MKNSNKIGLFIVALLGVFAIYSYWSTIRNVALAVAIWIAGSFIQIGLPIIGIIILLIVLAAMLGRIFCKIPQNHVGGVFVGGIRKYYRVPTKEELDKLTEEYMVLDPSSGKTAPVKPNVDKSGKSLVKLVIKIPFITDWTNIAIFSFNPFATIEPVEIYKNHWSKPGEWNEEMPIEKRAQLDTEGTWEKYLRIDSIVIGIDKGVELRGNTMINYARQSNVRVCNLDEIYITQNRRFSSYVDETARGAFVSLLNQLNYDKPTEKFLSFEEMSFTENAQPFNREVSGQLSGAFGITILNSSITDWEVSGHSATILEAINNETASTHNLIAAQNVAKGKAAEVLEKGLAEATIILKKGDAEAKATRLQIAAIASGVTANPVAGAIYRDTKFAENLGETTGTVVVGKEVLTTLPVGENKPKANPERKEGEE